MFQATILPILGSIRLCNTAYGMLYQCVAGGWSGDRGTDLVSSSELQSTHLPAYRLHPPKKPTQTQQLPVYYNNQFTQP